MEQILQCDETLVKIHLSERRRASAWWNRYASWVPEIFKPERCSRYGQVMSWLEWKPSPIPGGPERWVWIRAHVDTKCDNEILTLDEMSVGQPHPEWPVGSTHLVSHANIPYRRVTIHGTYKEHLNPAKG